MRTSLIVAADSTDVIGADGGLPWHLPEDLKRFKQLTVHHAVVVGRLTHESIVGRLGRALPGRVSVVVTRQAVLRSHDNVIYSGDLSSALSVARAVEEFAGRGEIFVIGGAEIYRQALPEVERVYLTRVHDTCMGDRVMPPGWLNGFQVVQREDHTGFAYLTYERG